MLFRSLVSQIIILLSFLLFNFPSAKIFLGDSGAYLFGALTSLNTIITNNLNPKISSFFFCTLLFYLFFEVFTPSGVIGESETNNKAPTGILLWNPTVNRVAVSISIAYALVFLM